MYEGIVDMHATGMSSDFYAARVMLPTIFDVCHGEPWRKISSIFDVIYNTLDLDMVMNPVAFDTPRDDKYRRVEDEINEVYVRLATNKTLGDRVQEWFGYTRYPFIGDMR
jgi:hypothetical protein